jgi:hypothetical protein
MIPRWRDGYLAQKVVGLVRKTHLDESQVLQIQLIGSGRLCISHYAEVDDRWAVLFCSAYIALSVLLDAVLRT